jgi:GT2 family glycosyltransferase
MKDTAVTEEFQSDYFDKSLALFDAARQATGSSSEVFLTLAGATFRLVFSSSAIRRQLFPALAHLEKAGKNDELSDFTFFIWDSHSSGVPMLPPPCDRAHFTDRGDIWGFAGTRYRFAFHYGEFSLNLFDREKGTGIFWVENPAHLPYWTYAAPLRTLFHWCMEMCGCQLLHAAAIGTDQGAVLLTGAGGSGKSTTALAGLVDGMRFAGDDYIVVKLSPAPSVFTLYSTAKINSENIEGFHQLKHLMIEAGENQEKAVYQLFPVMRNQLAREMPIVGILAPRINGSGTTQIHCPASDKEIPRAASFTTVSQLPYAGNYTYDFIEKLIKSVPSFVIDLGQNREDILAEVKRFIGNPELHDLKNAVQKQHINYPSLSVVVPVFNREQLIAEALKNIVSQGYPDVDIVVVNDGSEDNSEEVILSFPYDILYLKQQNSGPAQARNRGIVNCRSEYIAFLDSDDLWPEGMLRYLVETLHADGEADVVRGYCQLAYRDAESGMYTYTGNPLESFPNYITGSVFRRSVFHRVGLFDKDLRFGEDNDWFNRALEMGVKVKRLDCTSVIVRRHESNMTKGKNLVQLNVLRVFKKALDRKRSLQGGLQDPDIG